MVFLLCAQTVEEGFEEALQIAIAEVTGLPVFPLQGMIS